ncbi:glycerol-3-phosphate dehydrogenase [Halobacteriales archaeon QS_3_64_16]|nr:MAG: glycerol-3-phosphate dehydrogenase [Halobacteriales archaeon QS_3_64_16]
MTDTDVLVIGGGGTGVGVARDLAMRGIEITLCERDGLGGGTSGRSHGLLHSGARYAESDPEGARECIPESRTLKRIAGECIRDSGGYFLQVAGDDPAYFDEKRRACEEVGIDFEVLSGEDAREAVPALSPDVERVMEVPDGLIYPSRLVAATARSAQEHGAHVHTHAPVSDLHVENGHITGATVSGIDSNTGKRIDAEYVVNATGAWAGRLDERLAIEMEPAKGVMVAVPFDGLDRVLNRCREPDDGDIVISHPEQAILGTTSVPVDDPEEYDQEDWEVEQVIEECAAMLPGLEDREPERVYWGVRPLYAPDEAEREQRGISRGFFLLDHKARDDLGGICSIVGGKLTTHRLMAEAVADHVAERLGVEAACHTAEETLPGADDPALLDRYVGEFDARGPADEDVLGV